MGIYRETVAKWECGESEISPQHDYILRGLCVCRLRGFADLWDYLDRVRTGAPAQASGAPLRLDDVPRRMREHPSYRDQLPASARAVG
jgi:hypothetical protein